MSRRDNPATRRPVETKLMEALALLPGEMEEPRLSLANRLIQTALTRIGDYIDQTIARREAEAEAKERNARAKAAMDAATVASPSEGKAS